MNKGLVIIYTLTLLFGISSIYQLAYPTEPMRMQSMYALLFQFFFMIGFGFIIGNETYPNTHKQTIKEITVSLFVDEEHTDKMKRAIIPSVGDSIVIDCGNLVKVIDVNHDWSTPDLIQINCISVKGDE